MVRIVWDMETNDPDDFLTLLLLLGQPQVRLEAVTVTPGSAQQVGLVRRALAWFGRDLPVGAGNLDHPKPCVSGWHEKAYGAVAPSRQAEPAAEVLLRCCDEGVTLVTGGPLKNLGAALALGAARGTGFRAGRLVAQGGFAGVGVVPPERQLDKFRGLRTCPTFNLNGDPKSVFAALAHQGFGVRRFVSKNVCHGVVYDPALHEVFAGLKDRSLAHELIWRGMEVYLRRDPAGKKLHDPLAACCAIDEEVGTWAEVELFRERGEWGARPRAGSGTWIITGYDRERFLRVLTACAPGATG
jgi:pyrimidine-specific ribonucleoside hydrolase